MNKRILLSLVLVAAMLLPTFATASASGATPQGTNRGLLSYATLGATTGDAVICTGETTDVFIDLTAVSNLYGYQFEVSYDDSLVSADADFVNSFFDVNGDGAVPGGLGGAWDATCTGGTCSFAKTELGPDSAVSGSGTLAKITLTGVTPGTFDVTISNDVLSDIDGIALTHNLGAPLPITVCGSPRLSARATTGDTLICTGETTEILIDLDCAANLYGYQFEVSYDDSLVSADADFVNSFFDVDGDGAVPGGPGGAWDATCTGGTCSFAKTELGPDSAVSGSGTLVKITLTGVTPGTFDVTFSNDVLSNIDGIALTHDLGAPLPITVCGLADISGYITMQGRPGNNVDAGTVSMIELAPADFTPVAPVPFSPSNGAYSITVPYMPGGSSYKILAAHGLYLNNEDTITVSADLANKNTWLWGGDANNSGKVTIADLSCIGGAFGESPVTSDCEGAGSPDINADGRVSIQDLSLAGGNYDKCNPQPWNWSVDPPNYLCTP